MKTIVLNDFIKRIEQCIVNAKTEQAKRLLFTLAVNVLFYKVGLE